MTNSGNDKNDICGLTCGHEMFIFISFLKEKIGSYVLIICVIGFFFFFWGGGVGCGGVLF